MVLVVEDAHWVDDATRELLLMLARDLPDRFALVLTYRAEDGDKPGQWDFIAKAFAAQFPGVKIHLVTDLSKIHDARIDNQIATHDQVADVAVLQTVQDFDRWKSAGQLLKYRPIGSDEVFDNAKDSQGYWTGVFCGAFADMVNTKAAGSDPSAFTAADLLKPEFTKKLIFTYPNDDDAVLYDFKLTVDKYGWTWLRSLVAQNPAFVRGTPFPPDPWRPGTTWRRSARRAIRRRTRP